MATKLESDETTPKAQRRWRALLGTLLIVLSYCVYPTYAALAFLPLTKQQLAGAAFASWLASWVVFSAGAFLVGRVVGKRISSDDGSRARA